MYIPPQEESVLQAKLLIVWPQPDSRKERLASDSLHNCQSGVRHSNATEKQLSEKSLLSDTAMNLSPSIICQLEVWRDVHHTDNFTAGAVTLFTLWDVESEGGWLNILMIRLVQKAVINSLMSLFYNFYMKGITGSDDQPKKDYYPALQGCNDDRIWWYDWSLRKNPAFTVSPLEFIDLFLNTTRERERERGKDMQLHRIQPWAAVTRTDPSYLGCTLYQVSYLQHGNFPWKVKLSNLGNIPNWIGIMEI